MIIEVYSDRSLSMILNEFMVCNIAWIMLYNMRWLDNNPFFISYLTLVANLSLSIATVHKINIFRFFYWIIFVVLYMLFLWSVPIEIGHIDIGYGLMMFALWLFVRAFIKQFVIELFV